MAIIAQVTEGDVAPPAHIAPELVHYVVVVDKQFRVRPVAACAGRAVGWSWMQAFEAVALLGQCAAAALANMFKQNASTRRSVEVRILLCQQLATALVHRKVLATVLGHGVGGVGFLNYTVDNFFCGKRRRN